jgi:hypothetical protein
MNETELSVKLDKVLKVKTVEQARVALKYGALAMRKMRTPFYIIYTGHKLEKLHTWAFTKARSNIHNKQVKALKVRSFLLEMGKGCTAVKHGPVASKLTSMLPQKDTAGSVTHDVAGVKKDMRTVVHIGDLESIAIAGGYDTLSPVAAGRDAGNKGSIV